MRNKLRIMNLLLVNVISFFSLDKHHSYLTLERTEILEGTKMFRGDVYLWKSVARYEQSRTDNVFEADDTGGFVSAVDDSSQPSNAALYIQNES